MKSKLQRLLAITLLLPLFIFATGCGPAPVMALDIAIGLLDTASAIPTLTPQEQQWVSQAALWCSQAATEEASTDSQLVKWEVLGKDAVADAITVIPAGAQWKVVLAFNAVQAVITALQPSPAPVVSAKKDVKAAPDQYGWYTRWHLMHGSKARAERIHQACAKKWGLKTFSVPPQSGTMRGSK